MWYNAPKLLPNGGLERGGIDSASAFQATGPQQLGCIILHAVKHSLALLRMSKKLPETCWADWNINKLLLLHLVGLLYYLYPRRCLCFNTHTVYTVVLVCLTLCTWPFSGSHEVNKVHTGCRIAVILFFLQYFSGHNAENCAVVGHYTLSSGSFLPTFRDNLSFLPLCSGGGLLCIASTPVRFLLSRSVSL